MGQVRMMDIPIRKDDGDLRSWYFELWLVVHQVLIKYQLLVDDSIHKQHDPWQTTIGLYQPGQAS